MGMNDGHVAAPKELSAALKLGILLASAKHLEVPVGLVTKSGGLRLPPGGRRRSHFYPGMRKVGAPEALLKVWGSLAATSVNIATFQTAKERFPGFHSQTNAVRDPSWLFALSSTPRAGGP